MNKDLQKPPLSWALISVFVIVSAVVIVSGILFTNIQKEHLKTDKEDELKAYADLKVAQIEQWRNERLSDALLIQDNLSLVDQISDFLYNSNNSREKNDLLEWMKSITTNYDYFSAIIIDKGGRARLGLTSADSLIGSFLRPLIPAALADKKVILTDLHRAHKNGSIHLDLIIPLIKKGNDTVAIGLVVLRIDPSKILFRSVQSWPTKSRSSETLLLRREGDSVIYLNELKHQSNTALNLKRPISDTNFIGARALRGITGITEGKDYRNVPVLAVIKAVQGTPWFMISKVDKQELISQLNSQQLIIRLLIIFIISAFGAVIGWMIWHQRVRFYRNRYEAEAEKMALKTHFDYLLKYANDIVLLIDEDLTIVEVNDRAIEVYKFSRNEIIGMDVRKLRAPEELDKLEDMINILRDCGSTTYETVHVNKDGDTFPIEISARLFEVEGVKYFQSIGRDITERKRIESNLNSVLERYNLATQAGQFAIWDWDVNNDVLLWDDRVYELFGVKKGEVVPVYESWLKILHPDDAEKANNEIEQAIKGQNNYDTEFRVIHSGGAIKYIKAFGHVVRDENGSPVRMIGINFDITAQKTAENLLRERDFWLSESQRVGRIGSYDFDISNLLWTSSEVLDDIFGIDDDFPRTLDGWNKIVHPDFRDKMMKYVLEHVVHDKNPFDIEYKIVNQKTGKESWVYGRGELSFGFDRKPIRMIGTIQDISERKNSEMLLRKTEQTYTVLFDTVSDAIYIHKTDGIFMDVNQGAIKMYGYSREELIGKTPESVSAPGMNDLNQLAITLQKVFDTGKSEQFEFWGKRKNGEIFPKEVVSNKGKYFGEDVIISTARDVTERKVAENQLIKAKEKAEESDRLKTAFLHNISHEIRTPMNAIVGFTALLDEPGIEADSRKQFINIISQSTNQLLSIISDIVDISNIETNQVKLNISEVNINTIIKDLYDQFKITADQQKLLFFYEVKEPDETSVVNTDKTKLVQILSNLLNNSFKFTKQGTVQFGYCIKNNSIEFYVNDTGIGVPEDKKSKIFDRFYQIENNSSRQYSGAGLGLSICKAYVEILGGSIWVESRSGSGSSFHFTVPL
jgi:PAS domain S-box-containing protein